MRHVAIWEWNDFLKLGACDNDLRRVAGFDHPIIHTKDGWDAWVDRDLQGAGRRLRWNAFVDRGDVAGGWREDTKHWTLPVWLVGRIDPALLVMSLARIAFRESVPSLRHLAATLTCETAVAAEQHAALIQQEIGERCGGTSAAFYAVGHTVWAASYLNQSLVEAEEVRELAMHAVYVALIVGGGQRADKVQAEIASAAISAVLALDLKGVDHEA